MPDMDLKSQIHEYLNFYGRGAANAKTGKTIAQEFHTEWRTVAGVIRQLRIEGVLIGSSKGNNRVNNALSRTRAGYYLPETVQEEESYLKSFKDELFDMLKTFRAQKKARNRFLEERQYKASLIVFKPETTGQLTFV